jgi:glycosyltransferase involved in cell wall biosynthesis
LATVLLSYRDHVAPKGGGAIHGHHVVEQLRRLGHRLITAEPRTDERLTRYPRTTAGMRAMLRDADVIYVRCDARPWDEALLALNRVTSRRPVVVEVNSIAEEQLSHDVGPVTQAKVAVLRLQYHGIVRLADAALCVSTALADFLRRTYPIAPDRIHVVPNGGVPAAELPPPRGDRPFRAVWTGFARWPWQALDTILAASSLLRERVPGAEVALYTEGDAARFAPYPAIRHHAPLPHRELTQALQSFDAALCLYRPQRMSPAGFYNSPLKLFDYMAAGLPVVASQLGQICEVVEDGVSGLLVGDDPAAVADALAALARDPARARAMGEAARARIAARYTWDHAGDRIADVLRKLGVRGSAGVETVGGEK